MTIWCVELITLEVKVSALFRIVRSHCERVICTGVSRKSYSVESIVRSRQGHGILFAVACRKPHIVTDKGVLPLTGHNTCRSFLILCILVDISLIVVEGNIHSVCVVFLVIAILVKTEAKDMLGCMRIKVITAVLRSLIDDRAGRRIFNI